MSGSGQENYEPEAAPTGGEGGRLIPRTRMGKVAHLLFWTALFYGLAWGVAELCEWLSG